MSIPESMIKAAFDVSKWASNAMHRVLVPKPNLRKRVAGNSYTLSVDLYNCSVILASNSAESGMVALSRSVIENYARGFWASYVADEISIKLFLEGRDKKTFEPLLRAIKKANVSARPETSPIALHDHVKTLDSFAHGGLEHAKLRGIDSSQIGSPQTVIPLLLIFGASVSTCCVENFARSLLEDEAKAAAYADEGAELVMNLSNTLLIRG